MNEFETQSEQNQTEYQSGPNFAYRDYKPKRNNAFMIISLLFGIAAIVTSSFFITAFLFGGLAILFAILSKGDDEHVTGTALGGLITAICGIALSIVVTASAFYMFLTDPSYRNLLNDTCQQMYGITFDQMLDGQTPGMEQFNSPDNLL